MRVCSAVGELMDRNEQASVWTACMQELTYDVVLQPNLVPMVPTSQPQKGRVAKCCRLRLAQRNVVTIVFTGIMANASASKDYVCMRIVRKKVIKCFGKFFLQNTRRCVMDASIDDEDVKLRPRQFSN